MKLLRKKSNYIWVLIYGFFYMISFICLERSNAQPHLIHSVVDESRIIHDALKIAIQIKIIIAYYIQLLMS